MVKTILAVTLSAMMIVMLVCLICTKNTKEKLAHTVRWVLISGLFAIIMETSFIMSRFENITIVVQGLYYVSLDIFFIYTLQYVQLYTELFKEKRAVKTLCFAITIVDFVFVITNISMRHMFDVEEVTYNGEVYWTTINYGLAYYLHITFTCILRTFIILSLLTKMIKAHAMYKRNYLVHFLVFSIGIVLNIIYGLFNFPFDISIFIYCGIGVIICYYSLFSQQKKLINDTLWRVAEKMNDAIICFDAENKCLYENKALNTIFKKTAELEAFKQKLVKENDENMLEFNDELQWSERAEINEKLRYLNITYHKLFDKKNKYIGCFYNICDRTDEIEKFQKSHYLATHDRVTDVYTREYFFEQVEKRLREQSDEEFYMICSRIKDFKIYNDLFGEENGNKILKMEADLLKKYVHKGSLYGRISGSKFAVLVHKDYFNEEIFVSCMDKMKEQFDSDTYKLHIYAGIYQIEDNRQSASLICDKCQYSIDALGEDYSTVLTYYTSSLMENSIHEKKIISEFDNALQQKQFVMYLQPQISSDNKLRGAEALVRWQHPEKGLVFPGDFIDVLEKSGLIYRLDKYIWEKAAECLAKWKQQNIDSYISVNISVKDFEHLDIYNEFIGLVEAYEIAPKKLKLEITETVFMNQKTKIKEILDKLRGYGFIIEMDDFGSGYSSLNMLKEIDVDVVKIDMGFMRKTEREERSNFILKSMISLIKQLGMEVITEGVETKLQVDNVTSMGCDLFQGYFFDKPMSLDAFEEKYITKGNE